MAIARYKDLCIDTGETETLGRFYAAALGLTFTPDGEAGALTGPEPGHRIWMNVVPESKTAKHRVHIDVNCAKVEDLLALGARRAEQAAEGLPWTVLLDPEDGEICAFERDPAELGTYRLHELVIDCVEPREIAAWWADVFGVELGGRDDKNWWWITDVPGMPYGGWDFVPVPEPKTVKNRVHWDVLVESVDDLTAAGATLLRPPTGRDTWSIMADPEGNEFCAFVKKA